ncbi:hypothetical protein FACS1894202_02150 [Clostridia bacterium]|nr:hypothetical protein FACS1894202_02150 [Clostridia bacterium]
MSGNINDFGLAIDDTLLEKYARNEAKLLKPRGLTGLAGLRRGIMRKLGVIDAYAARAKAFHDRQSPKIIPEFEWLLDNRYLLEREGKHAALALKRAGRLPGSAKTRKPALFAAMLSLVRATRGAVTLERLELFLRGLQTERELTESELSLLIPILRAALIDMAAFVCEETREILTGREISRESHAVLEQCIGNVVTSLRLFAGADVSALLREASVMEQTLRGDPSGQYRLMDEETRMSYRQELSRIAKREGISERDAAKKAIALSIDRGEHVGYYIFRKPLGKARPKTAGRVYFASLAGFTLAASALFGLRTGSLWMGILSVVLWVEIGKNLCDTIATRLVPPTYIPRMECKAGLPREGFTLCVITSVISKPEQGSEFVAKLEQYYLSNRDAGENIRFGILADLPDRVQYNEAIWDTIKRDLERISRKYGRDFYLFTRDQVYVKGERRYMGWERKRGELTELMRLLRGRASRLIVRCGDPDALNLTQFVITLDADTRLSAGTARPLAAAMLHPLNVPVIDPQTRTVTEGYGLLQPRMGVDLTAASKTFFTRLYAGLGGLDPYGGNVSDVYQDVFGRGAFVGKGIIHVDAFLECLDNRFPEGRILSHDLLEGAYIRAGFAGDLEWSDGYPSRVSAWLERGHRWTRGDWQIAAWLSGKVPNNSGKERNPLSKLAKWQIFDNLRRSVTPLITLLALTFGTLPLMSLAALTFAFHLLLSAGRLAFRGAGVNGQRYHSTVLSGVRGTTYQLITQLFLLPQQAFSGIHAAAAALFRVHISHRNLLNWRTAADADANSGNAFGWSALLWGALSVATSNTTIPALGIIWIFSPIYAALISRPQKAPRGKLSREDREYLKQHAASQWKYFEDFATAADHYLPPDNWQERPKPSGSDGLARRTSPTNIGLAMLSALAANDLKIIDQEVALRFIERMLTTIEKLPSWHGHLYNWYDTSDLQPLRPVCVSTVDSGNFAGCLVALREGLGEWDDPAAEDLAVRAQVLYERMDFRPLYDKKRFLFYIGYDLELECPTDSYYDLLASEARQTSYIAVARGQTPRKHWRRLGRVLAARERYSGMTSWTGTMFEYVMPHLLLPIPENSLIYESLRFAVYCQRKRGRERRIPWGVSESCFYAFDAALNYQYKAHGDPRLAYKRGLGQELVVTPYASFLALQVETSNAIDNLKRLESLQLNGKYGLCEAADFTPSRLTSGENFMPVRCYMSHHIGMSLIAIDNVLRGNIMQKRFMRDAEMGAYRELLEEKVPVGGVVMKARGQEVPEKPARGITAGWSREYSDLSTDKFPNCGMLSNASYSLFCADSGLTASVDGNLSLTRFAPEPNAHGLGWRFFIRNGEDFYSLTAAPSPDANASYSVSFDLDATRWKMENSSINAKIVARVPRDEHGEIRVISITNTTKTPIKLELCAYLEPTLSDRASFDSHPAFSKLFLQTRIADEGVLVTRRPRGKQNAAHMAVICDTNADCDTSRERALPRGGAAMLKYLSIDRSDARDGSVLDPCVLQRIKIQLAPDETKRVRFALASAASENDAMSAAQRILRLGDDAPAAGFGDAMRRLGLSPAETGEALEWLGRLVFPRKSRTAEHNRQGQPALWRWGISGDLPIMLVGGLRAQPDKLDRVLRQYRFLSLCGLTFDLAVNTREGGDYRRPQRARVMEVLKTLSCEHLMGARGGVHIVDAAAFSPEDAHLLHAAAALILDDETDDEEPLAVNTEIADKIQKNATKPVKYSYTDDNSFTFSGMPEVAWGHTLTNNVFGALVRDTGFGHVWRLNARENKFTPWDNDPRALQGAETLYISTDSIENVSPFSAPDGYDCAVTYGFGYAEYVKHIGEIELKITIFVPPYRMARVVVIESSANVRIDWRTPLIMGADASMARHVVTETDGNCEVSINGYNTAYNPQMAVRVVSLRHDGVAVLVLGAAENRDGLRLLRELSEPNAARRALEETKSWWAEHVKPDEVRSGSPALDHYLNGWALYQVIASRLFARASLYQCGGAYGFRDQLQDSCAALYADSKLTRIQILRACAHQFEEGDVQHWWHPARREKGFGDRGVRTRCSDDLLWLPYTVCEYLDLTDDRSLLEIAVPYLSAPPLEDKQDDRFDVPRVSDLRESVLDHCVRAIDCVLKRGVGEHGLLLIGGGDWNDGFDKVGAEGRGESVWLTWFASHVLERFSKICGENPSRYRNAAQNLTKAADDAWDGEWYTRGYYDDGTPLGSKESDECRIDSIAQSFSALCLSNDRVRQSLDSALKHLADFDNRLIKLFDPSFGGAPGAFDKTSKNPGYIKGYVPGVRENGGQYTHAAIWLAMGFVLDGRPETGRALLELLLPETHDLSVYKAEPHVLAADVYACPPHVGRGGWSHYTGAAAWYYRVARMAIDKGCIINRRGDFSNEQDNKNATPIRR